MIFAFVLITIWTIDNTLAHFALEVSLPSFGQCVVVYLVWNVPMKLHVMLMKLRFVDSFSFAQFTVEQFQQVRII